VTVVGGRYRITSLQYGSGTALPGSVQICIQRRDNLGALPNIFGTTPQLGFHVRRCSGSACDNPVFIPNGQCTTIQWDPVNDVIYSIGGADDAAQGQMTTDGYFGFAHMVPKPIITSYQLGTSLNIVDIGHMLVNGNTIYMDISCPGGASFDVEVDDYSGNVLYKNTYTCSDPQVVQAYNLTVSSPLYLVKITFGGTTYTMDSKYLEGGLLEVSATYNQNVATLTDAGEGIINTINLSPPSFTAHLVGGAGTFDFVYGLYNVLKMQWDFQKSVAVTGNKDVTDSMSPSSGEFMVFIAGGKNWDMMIQVQSQVAPSFIGLPLAAPFQWTVGYNFSFKYAVATYKGIVAESLFWLPGETQQTINTVLIPVTYGVWDRVDSDSMSVAFGIKPRINTIMSISQI